MSKIVEWFLLPLFFVMSILYAFNSLGSDIIELKKLYHHTTSDNDETYLEKGTISCYFSSEPQMNKKDDTLSFFFPCVVNSQECKEMIEKINRYHGNYTVKIEQSESPQQGITIAFVYNPQEVSLSYETFDSIGMQKGVVFHLYNKKLLKTLETKSNQPLLRMLHNKKPSIALDFGHGGIDTGAIGHGNCKEKDICLAIGSTVADLLRNKGHDVFLTRAKDETVLLDERTFIAHQHHADCFISIHANYALNNVQTEGIETFCLQPHLFKECFSTLSANEKKNVLRYVSDKITLSHTLATSIQQCLCTGCYNDNEISKQPFNRHVKNAVSQVLLGSQMPAVLIEVGFLSHQKEAQLLSSFGYQKFIAERIVDGIIAAISA